MQHHRVPQTCAHWIHDTWLQDGIPLIDVKEYIFHKTMSDTWADADMGDVLQYMYANKNLDLSEDQRSMIRALAYAWE